MAIKLPFLESLGGIFTVDSTVTFHPKPNQGCKFNKTKNVVVFLTFQFYFSINFVIFFVLSQVQPVMVCT